VLAPNFPGGLHSEVMDGVEVRRFNYFVPRWQALCYRSGMLPNLKRSLLLWIQVPFYFGSLCWCAVRLIRKESVDLIHAHWVVPQGIVTGIARWFVRIPVVLTVHGGDIFAFRGVIGTSLKRFALTKSSVCTANSVFTREQILETCRHTSVSVVPMGVDVSAFHPDKKDPLLRDRLGIQGEMILFVGRLVEKKGAHHLLAAMQQVLERFPTVTLVLVGDGTQRQELELMARRLGIDSAVRFLGKLPHEHLPEYYAAADLFVGPSVVDRSGDTEGLGVVFIEAAAAGLAIVGTSVGGISDILIHEITGIAVQPDSPEELASAIERLLRDSDLRQKLGAAARQHALSQFSWGPVAASFSGLFEQILNRPPVEQP